MSTATKKNHDLIHLIVMLTIIGCFFVCDPFSKSLSSTGMKVLGVFLAGCYGWATAGVFWPSILCMIALPFTGVATMQEILAAGPGNFMFLFILFMLVFNEILDQTGVNVTIAKWFISRKIVAGKPWVLLFFLIFATYLISTVCSIFICLFLTWSLIYGICESVGYKKHDKLPTILVIYTLFVCMMGYLTMPFHGMVVQLLAGWAKMSGTPVAFGTWLSFSIPIGFGSVLLSFLVIKYIIRPDVEKLRNYDPSIIKSEEIRFTKPKVLILCTLLFFVFALLIAGFLPSTNPFAYVINTLGQSGFIALIIVLLLFIKIDGKPLFDFKQTAAKGISWDILMCTMYMLALGTYLSSPELGINKFFLELFMPILGSLSPTVFAIILGLIIVILTQLLANLAVAFMFLPIVLSFAPVIGFNATAVAMVVIFAAHLAMITPASSIYAAIMHANTEWVTRKEAMVYSAIIIIAVAIIMIPIASLLSAIVA